MLRRLILILILSSLLIEAVNTYAGTPTKDQGQLLWGFLKSHGYGVLKIHSEHLNSQYVDATINGKQVLLAIDTGSDKTRLSRACSEALGLDVHDTGKAAFSLGGRIKGSEGVAKVASFKLGGYEINRTDLVTIMPRDEPSKNADGLLGYDFLKANSMILPVGAGFVFFKPGNAGASDASAYMKALGLKAVPLTYSNVGLVVSGHINGSPLTAVVDFGASLSVFSINFLTGPARAPVRFIGAESMGLDGHKQPTFVFTPSKIDFGGVILRPEPLLGQYSPLLLASGHQGLFGYDLLAEHSSIIDLGHDILWMK
jgi:predicted aspartyl protease